jgi:mono/diheme cytochrome c family protein
MNYLLLLLAPLFLCASANFITQKEYAAQLFKNPRGIGCQHCHGTQGEGKLIASYTHKKEKKKFIGPPINRLDYQAFYRALSVRKSGMPRYFLTDEEVQALYLHLHKNDKKKSVAKKKNVK